MRSGVIFLILNPSLKGTIHTDTVRSAKLCKLVYDDPKRRKIIMKRDNRKAYVAFKGTSLFGDWIYNLNSRLNSNDIHAGFDHYAQECIREVNMCDLLLQKQMFNTLVLSGHSLGSVALLLTLYYSLQRFEMDGVGSDKLVEKVQIHLFGCPKIGGATFANTIHQLFQKYGIEVQAYVTSHDIVPNYPPSSRFVFPFKRSILSDNNCTLNSSVCNHIHRLTEAHSIHTYAETLKTMKICELKNGNGMTQDR
jgi:hypothetical protein